MKLHNVNYLTILSQIDQNSLTDAFDYLARNLHLVQTAYEKTLVAYALSLSSRAEKQRAYEMMKASATEEIELGTVAFGDCVICCVLR